MIGHYILPIGMVIERTKTMESTTRTEPNMDLHKNICNQLWNGAAERLHLKPSMGIQYTEMRKAFYSGLASMSVFLKFDVGALEEHEAMDVLAKLEEEISEFWKNEVKEWEKMHGKG